MFPHKTGEAGHEKTMSFRHSFPHTLTEDAQGSGVVGQCIEEVAGILYRCWELQHRSPACPASILPTEKSLVSFLLAVT